MRIPYDSESLAAVAEELRAYVGGKVQGVRQPNDTDVLLALYNGGEAWLLLSAHPEFARAYLTTRRPPGTPIPPTFCATLRARLEVGRLEAVEVPEGERILTLRFADGHRLIAELMGKHSNVMLVNPEGRVVGALKWVSRNHSVRPVVSGAPYLPPPVLGRSEPFSPPGKRRRGEGSSEDRGGRGEGPPQGSPVLAKLRAAGGGTGPWRPVLSPGNGAYPYSVAPLGLSEVPRSSISVALETHYATAIPAAEATAIRMGLLTSLKRVLLARETAISGLDQAVAAGEKAGEWQRLGDLILAYGPSAPEGASGIDAWDYEGNAVILSLDPELGWKANAERYFKRARKAKARLGEVREQGKRLREEASRVAILIERVEGASDVRTLEALREEARAARWLQVAAAQAKKPEARPYEGHRVRELVAPGGWTVLYGESADANDYLTARVARSDDYWLHVRGGTSAHVVIQTRRTPDRVSREALEFAARVAARHSPSKHSGVVAVDYTLKKHVRKPRGAAKGSALYTHERTLHVEGL